MKITPEDKFEVVTLPFLKPESDMQRILKLALSRLEGGRKWCQTAFHTDDGKHCAIGAVTRLYGESLIDNRQCDDAIRYLNQAAQNAGRCGVMVYNDCEAKSFADIERVYLRAIELAAS